MGNTRSKLPVHITLSGQISLPAPTGVSDSAQPTALTQPTPGTQTSLPDEPQAEDLPSQDCLLTCLPDCVILEILTYLDFKSLKSVASTCKTLKDVAYIPKLWRHQILDLATEVGLEDPMTVESFTERSISTLRVNMIDRKRILEPKLKVAKENIKLLTCHGAEWTRFCVENLLLSVVDSIIRDPIELFGHFSHLRCLVLVQAKDSDRLCDNFEQVSENWATAISRLEDLEKLVLLIHIKGSDGFNEQQKAKEVGVQAILSKISSSMSNLRDLTIGNTYATSHNNMPYKEVQLAQLAPNLEMLKIMDGGRVENLMWISKQSPNLKHLVVNNVSGTCSGTKTMLSSFHCLESLVLGHQELIADHDLQIVPQGVKALHLREYQQRPLHTETVTRHRLIESAPPNTLVFLELDIHSQSRHTPNLCELIESSPKLQIIILSRKNNREMSDIFHQCIKSHCKNLFSLLGVELLNRETLPPQKISFITESYGHGQTLLEKPNKQGLSINWVEVRRFSPKWSRAYGTQLFYPQRVTETLEKCDFFADVEAKLAVEYYRDI